jgi:hypothetical protein
MRPLHPPLRAAPTNTCEPYSVLSLPLPPVTPPHPPPPPLPPSCTYIAALRRMTRGAGKAKMSVRNALMMVLRQLGTAPHTLHPFPLKPKPLILSAGKNDELVAACREQVRLHHIIMMICIYIRIMSLASCVTLP